MSRNQLPDLVADVDIHGVQPETMQVRGSSDGDSEYVKKTKHKKSKKRKRKLKKLKNTKLSMKSEPNSDYIDGPSSVSQTSSHSSELAGTNAQSNKRSRLPVVEESVPDEDFESDKNRIEMQELRSLLDASTSKRQAVETSDNDAECESDGAESKHEFAADEGSEIEEVDLPASIMGPLSEVQESMRMAFTGLQDLQEALENRERRMRRLEQANAMLKKKLKKIVGRMNGSTVNDGKADAQEIQCEACGQFVREDHVQKHHGGVESKCKCCVHHSGIFYAVEELPMRELDSDSDTYGMWNCCEAEAPDAIGCERGCHHL